MFNFNLKEITDAMNAVRNIAHELIATVHADAPTVRNILSSNVNGILGRVEEGLAVAQEAVTTATKLDEQVKSLLAPPVATPTTETPSP